MNWLFFALLSPAIFAVVSFVDKYIVEREVPKPRGMVIFTALLGLTAGTTLWVLGGFPLIGARDTALILFTGMLTSWGAVLYFEALPGEEASSILVLLQLTPVITFVLSFLFLGEVLSLAQFIGFALILLASVGITLKRGGGRFRFSSAFWWILGVDVMQAVALVLFKFVSASQPFLTIISYESLGIALGGLLVYLLVPTIRRAFHHDLNTMRRRGFAAILLNEGLFVVAKTLSFFAVSLGPVTLVTVLSSTSIFFGIFLGWVLTLLSPLTFKEDISRANLVRKGLLAGVLFAGILLVS